MIFNLKEIYDPATFTGSIFYALILLAVFMLISRLVHRFVARLLDQEMRNHADKTAILFYSRLLQVASFIILLIFYFHLVPALRSVGTALLTSASVISIIAGIAAQKTLGNLVAGIALMIYRPFRVGDHIQVSAPTGLETGVVSMIDLGYTILTSEDKRKIIIPNAILYESVTINLGKKGAE